MKTFDRHSSGAAVAIVVITFAVAALVAGIGRLTLAYPIAAIPTPALPIIIASPAPTVVVASQHGLERTVVAYDAPSGNVLGAIEQGRAYRVVARSGASWLQLDVDGSGLVWVQAGDLDPELADVPDLATPISQQQPAVVYMPAQPQAVDQIEVVNVPKAAPTMQAATPVPIATPAPVIDNTFAASFTAPDNNATCAFVGC